MSKEYLEAFNYIRNKFIDLFREDNPDFDTLEDALKRLEAIDNANPSEALEYLEQFLNEMTYCLEHPKEYAKGYERQIFWKFKNTLETTIKQALLKAQEPKQYLKWEDLKFTDERKTIKVLLNGEKYFVKYKKEYLFGYYEKVEITNGTFILCTLGSAMKQFFNDLRLERVEE